jgi:L-ascorbate metabolism protein UlaG (beta-lactamase superfamily)
LANFNEEDLKASYILVTHGHQDHLGDAISIHKRFKGNIVGIFELCLLLKKFYGVDCIGMNKGGMFKDKDLSFYMLDAKHSSSVLINGIPYYAGEPASYLIKIGSKILFHAGDTMLFEDLRSYSKYFGKIDVAMLPIGGFFTMDVNQAKIALEYLKPKILVPMHYNTFPQIRVNERSLKDLVDSAETLGIEAVLLQPGEALEL